jgi:hypothetical protein
MESIVFWEDYLGPSDPFYGAGPNLWAKKRSKLWDVRRYAQAVILLEILQKTHLHRPQTISKHVAASTQNIIDKLRGSGGGGKRQRASAPAAHNAKRKKTKRGLRGSKIIKSDIFS